MPAVIYADERDDITSIRSKLESASDRDVAIVVPRQNRPLANGLTASLLRRAAETAALDISIITRYPHLVEESRAEGLRVFSSVRDYQRSFETPVGWRGVLGAQLRYAGGELSSMLAGAIVTMAGIAAILAIYVFLPVANITVTPRNEVVTSNIQIIADPKASRADPLTGRAPARSFAMLVEVTDQGAPAFDRATDGRAVGIVSFTNLTKDEVVVPQGSVVATESGARFRTDAELKVPAGAGHSAKVKVVAIEVGPGGNAGRLQVNKLDSALAGKVGVQNDDPMAGGGQQVLVVTAADREALQKRALERARTESLARLTREPKQDETLVQESIDFQTADVAFDRDVGQEADILNVRVRARASATIINQGELEHLARQMWTPAPSQGLELAPNAAKVTKLEVARVDQGTVWLTAQMEATALSRLDNDRAVTLSRWHSTEEIESALASSFDLAGRPAVQFSPGWAQRAYRVHVTIEAPGGRASR